MKYLVNWDARDGEVLVDTKDFRVIVARLYATPGPTGVQKLTATLNDGVLAYSLVYKPNGVIHAQGSDAVQAVLSTLNEQATLDAMKAKDDLSKQFTERVPENALADLDIEDLPRG